MSGSYWCQSTETTTTYTVTARRDQVERWEAAASADGVRSVGSWLAETADARLRERAQSGGPPALPWLQDRFRVLVTDTTARPEVAHEIEVRGMVSGFFGIFRGDGQGVGEPGCSRYSLVHRPTRRIIVTLPLRKSCMALAAELAALRIDWQEVDPEKVLGAAPDREKAQAVIRLFEKLTCT
ncbi:MAG: hypothetical protein QOF89_1097 [Acidobacteriota bacterium]|jgi:hypothetical protein|nr:hypothetical protein [Acidobacteriota bacterium]